jgi:DNA polymerase sigma
VSAKVPIIKVTDTGTGIECDLSVENWDGIAKSHIIRAISAIDERFQKLCLLVIMMLLCFDAISISFSINISLL